MDDITEYLQQVSRIFEFHPHHTIGIDTKVRQTRRALCLSRYDSCWEIQGEHAGTVLTQ